MASPRRRLRRNSQWPAIADQLLGDSKADQAVARRTLWIEVRRYVEHVADLPIGALAEDVETRRDVAVKVLEKLEAKEYAAVRKWRRRRASGGANAAPWWGWINKITRNASIDIARSSKQNVARGRKKFNWIRLSPTDSGETARLQERLFAREQNIFDRMSVFEIIEAVAIAQRERRVRDECKDATGSDQEDDKGEEPTLDPKR